MTTPPLFSDSEVFTKTRPTKITEKQKQEYYKKVAQEIIDERWSKSDIEDIMTDLSDIFRTDSGYEIAKSLEDGCAQYNINTPFIEFLDSFDYNMRSIDDENVKLWVKAHNIVPLFDKGQELIVTEEIFRYFKREDIVYVNGINMELARYYVDKDKNRNGGYVLDCETIETHCQKK